MGIRRDGAGKRQNHERCSDGTGRIHYYSFALESESQPYLTIHFESDGQQIAVIYDGDMVEIQTIYDLKTYAANLELAAGTYSIAISGAKGAYTLRCAY